MEGGREGSGPGGEDEGHVAYGKSVYYLHTQDIDFFGNRACFQGCIT